MVEACDLSDRVYMKLNTKKRDFTFVYKFFFNELNILFPPFPFECHMLMAKNVSLSQPLNADVSCCTIVELVHVGKGFT